MNDPRFPDATLELGPDAERRLREYLEAQSAANPAEPRSRTLIKRAVPASLVMPTRAGLTRLLKPMARRRIAEARGKGALRLHLGSGFEYKPGWVNIDMAPVKVDIPWHLAWGVPFPDDSAEAVFHEHLMEHLTLRQGFDLLREALRVLRPGATLRIGVPDAGYVVQSYAGSWDPDWARSAPTGMVAIDRLFYEHGHRAMYDGQTLALMCRVAGFAEARREAFGEGRLQPSPDSPSRRDGTLYVEAHKAPAAAALVDVPRDVRNVG